MKHALQFFILFGLVLGVIALGEGFSEQKFHRVRSGMTEKEVLDLLGNPAEIHATASSESELSVTPLRVFTWIDGKKRYLVKFRDGKVVGRKIDAD